MLAPNLFPKLGPRAKDWQKNSAFITYHWEIFHLAHKSLQLALSSSYNAAYILLRAALESIIKGAFFDCLAKERFRDNAEELDREKHGKHVKDFLSDVILRRPSIKDDLERASVAVFDRLEPVIDDPEYRISVKTMINQVSMWEMFVGINNAKREIWRMYSWLSQDVHVLPDRTDTGKRLLFASKDLFKTPRVMPSVRIVS